MLSCAEFLAEFGDYLDDAAGPELRARLEAHLQECKACQVIVDSTRKTIRIVTDSDSFALPADKVEPIVTEIMARVRKSGPKQV
jgi:predicted anti-sigma-YlaC factor YlaD